MNDPTEKIREIADWLSDTPDELRRAINEMDPQTGPAEQNLHDLEDLADLLQSLEERFTVTLTEVGG